MISTHSFLEKTGHQKLSISGHSSTFKNDGAKKYLNMGEENAIIVED